MSAEDVKAEDAKAEDDEVAAMFDLKLKKKKKKKKSETEAGEGVGTELAGGAVGEGGEVDVSSGVTYSAASSSGSAIELDPPIYTYGQMLNRVVDFLHQNNPEMLEKRKYTMKPPQLMRGKLFFFKNRLLVYV